MGIAATELLFRGMVLRLMRDHHRDLIAVAAASALFGLSHIVAGPLNVVFSAMFGYLLYYTRRVSGGILVPIAVHALYDFSVWSSVTTDAPAKDGNASPALALPAVAVPPLSFPPRMTRELGSPGVGPRHGAVYQDPRATQCEIRRQQVWEDHEPLTRAVPRQAAHGALGTVRRPPEPGTPPQRGTARVLCDRTLNWVSRATPIVATRSPPVTAAISIAIPTASEADHPRK